VVVQVKIWFQNHRYKTKKAQKDRDKLDQKPAPTTHHHQPAAGGTAASPAAGPKRVAVPRVLVKDGKPCPSSIAPAAAAADRRSNSSSPESTSSDGAAAAAEFRAAAVKPSPFAATHGRAACPPFPVSSAGALVKGEPGGVGGGLGGRCGGMMMSSCDAVHAASFSSVMQPAAAAAGRVHAPPPPPPPLSLDTMTYADFAPPRSCLFNGRTW